MSNGFRVRRRTRRKELNDMLAAMESTSWLDEQEKARATKRPPTLENEPRLIEYDTDWEL